MKALLTAGRNGSNRPGTGSGDVGLDKAGLKFEPVAATDAETSVQRTGSDMRGGP